MFCSKELSRALNPKRIMAKPRYKKRNEMKSASNLLIQKTLVDCQRMLSQMLLVKLTFFNCLSRSYGNSAFSFICDGFKDSLGDGISVQTSEISNRSVVSLLNDSTTDPSLLEGVTLSNIQSQFYEIYDNYVFVITCPPIGEVETFEIVIRNPLPVSGYDDCVVPFNVTVVPTKPEISVAASATVQVGSSHLDSLDILRFRILNEGPCTTFICSVACTNFGRNFWVADDEDLIETFGTDILFDFIYELQLKCSENNVDANFPISIVNLTVSFSNGSSTTSENPATIDFSSELTTSGFTVTASKNMPGQMVTRASSAATLTLFIGIPASFVLARHMVYIVS